MRTLLAVLCFAVLASAWAACPQNCHDHGSCSHDVCTCDDGWSGDDCSISVTALSSGHALTGNLNTFTWKYYSIRVPTDVNGLNISVSQTNVFGDVDVFVQRGQLPTQTSNIASDTSTAYDTNLLVEPAPPGTYYIGLYAYFYVEYTVRADLLVTCTVDCGEHGSCVHNACACDSGYAGEQCELYDMELPNNAVAEGTVMSGEFRYYHTVVDSHGPYNMDLVVEQDDSDAACDIDVYLRRGSYPSLFEFDQANATIETVTEMHLRNIESGTWYIGIYGYHGCSYVLNLVVSPTTTCVSECSHHGSCSGNRCSCRSGFSGNFCETKTSPLRPNDSEDGFVEAGSWNYYHFQETTGGNVDVHVHQASAEADCDVYISADTMPTQYEFDYADTSFDQDVDVIVSNPSTSTWNIGVFGWTSCSYTISLSIPSQCPCVMGHGHCAPGSAICMCNLGYTGPSCADETMPIENGAVINDAVAQYEWKYYGITTNSSLMLISMRETDTEGALWLFASMSGFPQLDAYDAADKNTNTDFHEVHFTFKTKELRSFFIGVYGSPFDIAEEARFSVTAWSPEL